MQLRDYQQQGIDDILSCYKKGSKAVLFQLPTGGGKSVIIGEVVKRSVNKGNSVLLIVHRVELVNQLSHTLDRYGVNYGFVVSNRPMNKNYRVQIASLQTLSKRLDHFRNSPALIIIDESHRAVCKTYLKIVDHFKDSKLLGFTASPTRLSGEGLNLVFDTMVLGPTIEELINKKWLVEPRYYCPPSDLDMSNAKITGGDYNSKDSETAINKSCIFGNIVNHYRKFAFNKTAIAFCVTIAHANRVASEFTDNGISSEVISGMMSEDVRRDKLKRLEQGNIKVLVSVDVISEGMDIPSLECAIFLRPTASLSVFLQQTGRVLRPYKNKESAIIIDHVSNTFRFGTVYEPQEWTLEGQKKGKKKKSEPVDKVRRCKNCFIILNMTAKACHVCGSAIERTERELKQIEGELEELRMQQIRKEKNREIGKLRTMDELIAYGVSQNFANPRGWAWHRMKARSKND